MGKPTRESCGACHFHGGGGDHVKHGDLDASLKNPSRAIDAHMGSESKMSCQSCHKGDEAHTIKGEARSVSYGTGSFAMGCTDCHKAEAHKTAVLARHAKRVACQTCHIPAFAKDKYGEKLYDKMKGEFVWSKDVVPTCFWYDGTADRVLLGDKGNPSKVVTLTWARGDRGDRKSKIFPFKIMRGKQAYDSGNRTVAVANLFGPGGYWTKYDWNLAITTGMAAAGQPYSGKFGWTETSMVWPVNHMVAPKEAALKCADCHSEKESRRPFERRSGSTEGDCQADTIGLVAIGLVLAGVAILIAALVPVRELIAQLPPGDVRRKWYLLAAMILLFIAGYVGYAAARWRARPADTSDLIVPAVFFLGACFVLLVGRLSLETALDVRRVSHLEAENRTDALTGIYNRRYLERRLKEEAARASRYDLPLSLLLIDVDHFKAINDTHGHPVGDTVLERLGRLITDGVRDSDIVARYGGDEIVVIAPNTPGAEAARLGERLRQEVENAAFETAKDRDESPSIRMTVSVGVATRNRGCQDVPTMLKGADDALYAAKHEGRNRVKRIPSGA